MKWKQQLKSLEKISIDGPDLTQRLHYWCDSTSFGGNYSADVGIIDTFNWNWELNIPSEKLNEIVIRSVVNCVIKLRVNNENEIILENLGSCQIYLYPQKKIKPKLCVDNWEDVEFTLNDKTIESIEELKEFGKEIVLTKEKSHSRIHYSNNNDSSDSESYEEVMKRPNSKKLTLSELNDDN